MFKVQTSEYMDFLQSKKVDRRIATFPTIKNKRCLISFPGPDSFFLLEFMVMVLFFIYFFIIFIFFSLDLENETTKNIYNFPQIFPHGMYTETDNHVKLTTNP